VCNQTLTTLLAKTNPVPFKTASLRRDSTEYILTSPLQIRIQSRVQNSNWQYKIRIINKEISESKFCDVTTLILACKNFRFLKYEGRDFETQSHGIFQFYLKPRNPLLQRLLSKTY
jgi:hypothetical protein